MQLLYILKESLYFAMKTVTGNKMRTFLSLLGITIGIFAIISVFTMIDSLESNIRTSLKSLGDDIIYIEKWPWGPEDGQEYAWWKYLNRPVPTRTEAILLSRRIKRAGEIVFFAGTGANLKYKNNTADNIEIWGIEAGFDNIRNFNIEKGRYFSPYEIQTGKNLVILGNTLASELFQNIDPVDKTIRIKGKKAIVIGVFQKEGKSFFGGGSLDNIAFVPIDFLGTMTDLRSDRSSPMIWVKASENVPMPELKEELRGAMRSIRKIKPSAEDNFALNQTSIISRAFDQIFSMINIAGGFIGIFSVLVGAFGIANIMFVSVKERTSIIGIQKAVGAKNYYILLEVLYESVTLALLGGILGLVLIFAGTHIVDYLYDFHVQLTLGNIILGLIISSVVGIISGLAPAFFASRLNPVTAIHTTF